MKHRIWPHLMRTLLRGTPFTTRIGAGILLAGTLSLIMSSPDAAGGKINASPPVAERHLPGTADNQESRARGECRNMISAPHTYFVVS